MHVFLSVSKNTSYSKVKLYVVSLHLDSCSMYISVVEVEPGQQRVKEDELID